MLFLKGKKKWDIKGKAGQAQSHPLTCRKLTFFIFSSVSVAPTFQCRELKRPRSLVELLRSMLDGQCSFDVHLRKCISTHPPSAPGSRDKASH